MKSLLSPGSRETTPEEQIVPEAGEAIPFRSEQPTVSERNRITVIKASDTFADFQWTPASFFSFNQYLRYDPNKKRLRESKTSVSLSENDLWKLSISHDYLQEEGRCHDRKERIGSEVRGQGLEHQLLCEAGDRKRSESPLCDRRRKRPSTEAARRASRR